LTPDKKTDECNRLPLRRDRLLDAIRDQKVLWPMADMWAHLHDVQRVEFGGGILLIVVVVMTMFLRQRH